MSESTESTEAVVEVESPVVSPVVVDSRAIDALLIERAGYERRGLPDRVAAVDDALRAAGYEVPARQATAGRRNAKA
jgi:hypothetical protein